MIEISSEEDRRKCANPLCESIIDHSSEKCTSCNEVQLVCRQCGATARILARYCRCCACELGYEWVTEEKGLRHKVERSALRPVARFDLDWQLTFGVEMVTTPLATQGILVFALTDGSFKVVNELDSQLRTSFSVEPPVAFTPVVTEGFLYVSGGQQILCFDLVEALYGRAKRKLLPLWDYTFGAQEQITRPLLAVGQKVFSVVKKGSKTDLVFIDTRDGSLLGCVTVDTKAGKTTAAYLKDNLIFIGTRDGMILIIDSSSMEIVSSSKLGREIDTNILPSGRGDQVFFVLSDGQLWTTSLVTFESKPFGNTRGLIINSVATTDKYTAVAHGSGFAVFDQYGTQMWETSLDANSIVASPLISNDNCWIVDDTGVMFFFNLFDSVPRLRKRVFENTFALTPVLTDKHVIFSSRLGEIRAYLI